MNNPKILGRCLACGAKLSAPLFVLSNMPVGAQAMPSEAELADDKGVTLPLCRCEKCGLTQFDCEPVDYYRVAIRVVGLSKTMQDLRRADYQHLIDTYGLAGKKWLEYGCGNGDFLKVLAEFPVEIYGTEADEVNVKEARAKLQAAAAAGSQVYADDKATDRMAAHASGNAIETAAGDVGSDKNERMAAGSRQETGFRPENIQNIFPDSADMSIAGAPFDCFLSFNFLEHQPDPRSMLGCIRNNLKDGGIGLITVPSFEYILEKGHYYELIRDHIANYDMQSLENLVTSCGFKVLEKGFIGIGDTIRMVVQKEASVAEDPAEMAGRGRAGSESRRDIDLRKKYEALAYNYLMTREDIAGYMADLERKGRSIALWGAGHQGFTIASTTALKDNVKYIIDSSDKKYGRFAPASHLPIVPPETYFEDPVDVIMIAAPGYISEIERTIRKMYGVQGRGPGVPAICDVLSMTER